MADPARIARAYYQVFANRDRDAMEALIADAFSFTRPLDNRLPRDTFFERCWPHGAECEAFDFIHVVPHDDKVFVLYEGNGAQGRKFRNCERLTLKDGQITDAEVYFGWSLPHPAEQGGFIERSGAQT